jgi:lysylphosphatidylglycerol synthetase-like protein (DUF2156 family)
MPRTIRSGELGRKDLWNLLGPHLKKHGRCAFSYATLQNGLSYYLTDDGYLSFVPARHWMMSPFGKKVVFCNPVCGPERYAALADEFVKEHGPALFLPLYEDCAQALREKGYRVWCIGLEPEIPVQTYNTEANWNELRYIKEGLSRAQREGTIVREVGLDKLDMRELATISQEWLAHKRLNDREIWLYARKPVFEDEEDVRHFVAYDKTGKIIGFAFYDPIYEQGKVIGYCANICRCDERNFRQLASVIHMKAIETFRKEGKRGLNLGIAPFWEMHRGTWNDDKLVHAFLKMLYTHGNEMYNFQGLSFHKSRYRAPARPLYMATRTKLGLKDVYLAFAVSEIIRSPFEIGIKVAKGMIKGQPHYASGSGARRT